jgi:cytoskeleton protein RodZ
MAETVGEQLKKARLDRGLTLLEASHQTRIRAHYLEALENDRPDLLPSIVQGRGFLRLYTDFLKLPTPGLLSIWDHQSSSISGQTQKSDSIENEDEQPESGENDVEDQPLVDPIPTPTAPVDSMSSEMILVEIGRRLRHQRESLNLKIDDIVRFTHLRQRYIESLEMGRIDDLPSPVQGRGMLSIYARFLNMDDEVLLLRFADALQARLLERSAPKNKTGWFSRRPARKREGILRLLTPDLILGSLVIIGLFGFGLWAAAQVSAVGQDTPAEPSLIPISNLMLTVSPEVETIVETPVRSATPLPQQLAALVENPETGEVEATPTLPVFGDAPLQLYIIATQRGFLRVVADNKEVFNGRVIPGNAYPFSGKDQIELVTGNAAALQVFYNQEDLGILGGVGQVMTLLFIPGDITTPTPSASATPTPTVPATATIMPSPTVPTPTITLFVP